MSLLVGILADNKQQVSTIRQLVRMTSYEVAFAKELNNWVEINNVHVDVWIVSVQECHHRHYLTFLDYIEKTKTPVIWDDFDYLVGTDRAIAAKLLMQKISRCMALGRERPRAQNIWVLAASAGGPEAVSVFLKALDLAPYNTAFIYSQHMTPEMIKGIEHTIARTIGNNTELSMYLCDKAHQINNGGIYIVHPEVEIDIDDTGTIIPLEREWQGQYKPSIDQVIAKVARIYKHNCGAIIFSGMGDDGSNSCHYLTQLGGKVWAQIPESCAVDSMPLSAIEKNCVTLTGTPEFLAKNFSERFSELSPTQTTNIEKHYQ